MLDRHGQRWTEDEMAAAVEAYVQMLELQKQGSDFTKLRFVRALIDGPLEGRSRKSIEFRFCNISSVLKENSKTYIDGYAPLNHVAPHDRQLITELLLKQGIDV